MNLNEKLYIDFNLDSKEIDVQDEQRTIVAIATKYAVDRDGEAIKIKGINLKPYKLNPICLFNHDKNMPIGRCDDLKIVGDELIANLYISDDYIWDLISKKVLRTLSIGFMRKETRKPTKQDYAELQNDEHINELQKIISKSELVEISIVTLPSNREAIIQQIKSLNLGEKSLKKYFANGEIKEEDVKEVVKKDVLYIDLSAKDYHEEDEQDIIKKQLNYKLGKIYI